MFSAMQLRFWSVRASPIPLDGAVKANAPARRMGRGPLAAQNAETEEARQSLPLFQLIV